MLGRTAEDRYPDPLLLAVGCSAWVEEIKSLWAAAPGLKKLKLNRPGASPKLQQGPKIDYDVVVFGEFERERRYT